LIFESFELKNVVGDAFKRKPQSLTPYIIFAIIVHGILLWIIKLLPIAQMKLPITFDVRLMPIQAPERRIELEPNNIKSNELSAISSSQKAHKLHAPIAKVMEGIQLEDQAPSIAPTKIYAQTSAKPPTATISIAPNVNTSRYKSSIESLLDSARKIATEDAKNMPKDKGEYIALADRAFSPELAQTLAQKKKTTTGETHYANGMVKVVSPDGSEYCLQPSLNMPVGPFDSVSIPMTCP
jgi:hypothetical protein